MVSDLRVKNTKTQFLSYQFKENTLHIENELLNSSLQNLIFFTIKRFTLIQKF